MASIYDEEVVSIYDGEEPSTMEPESVTKPRAAYTVLATKPNASDFGEAVEEVSRQSEHGVSDLAKQATDTAIKEFERARSEATIAVAISDAPIEEKVVAADQLAGLTYEPNLINEAYINQASQYQGEDIEAIKQRVGEQLAKGVAGKILEDVEWTNQISQMRDQVALDMAPDSLLGFVGEFTEAIAATVIPEAYAMVAKDLFPEESMLIRDFTLAGETMVFLREKFQGMSYEDRGIYLPMFKESLMDRAGLVSENSYVAYMMINEIFSEELGLRREDQFDVDRLFNNVAGVLDFTLLFGTAARLTGKAIKTTTAGKVMSTIDSANPTAARDIRTAIMSGADTNKIEAAVGINATDVAIDLYPTFKGATNSLVPSGVVEHLEGLQSTLKKIEDDMAFGINYTQEEMIAMQARVVDSVKDINGAYNHSFSQLSVDVMEGKGFVVKAAIGKNSDVGFSGYDEAMKHFESNFAEGVKVDFMVRQGDVVREVSGEMLEELVEEGSRQLRTYGRKADAKRGAARAGFPDSELREVDGRWTWEKPKQEVWYRVEDKYDYNLSLIDENTLVFGGPTLDKGFVSSTMMNFLGDPATKFSRFVNKASIRASDLGQAVSGRMLGVIQQGVLKPLNRNQQIKVFGAIDEGSKQGKNFTVDELIGMGMNTDEVNAYYTIRGVMDLEWSLNNTRVYNTLARDGYESVENMEAGFKGFGKRMPQDSVPLDRGVVDVFDPAAGKIVTMNMRDVDTLYANGGTIMRSKHVLGEGKSGVTLLASGLDTTTRIRPLSRTPLQYRPGYVTRMYDENYFVKTKSVKNVDGKQVERWSVIAAMPTKTDADKLVAAMRKREAAEKAAINATLSATQRKTKEVEFDTFLDQALSPAQRFDDEFEYLHRTGGLITGRRGDHLKGLNDELAATLDPVDSMMKSITYTGGRVSHDDVIAGFEKRWVNTYGKQLGLSGIPDDLSKIAGKTFTEKGIAEAKELAGYIQAMRGVQGEWAGKWRGFMATLAEQMENTLGGGRAVKNIGDYVRGFNPVKTMRGLTFNILLASNPTRQLLLQANQITFLAGIQPKYFANGGLGRDFAAFMGAAGTRTRPQWGKYRAAAAKTLKMTEDDFEKLYDGFVRSGLPQSIDSHTFARDGLQDLSQRITGGWAERAGRTAINAIKAPMYAAKRVGFDAGEWSNVAMTYLVSWKDWTMKNPGKNWRSHGALDDIATNARDYALNMTKSGEFGYQRGIASLSTQFLSYQHKAFLAMAGAATGKGNRAFAELPRHQRIGLVASQFLMYGVDGFGLGATMDKVVDALGLDVPDEAKPFLDGLLYEYMLNGVINSITQDGTDINFSETLAPGSGVFGSFNDFIGNMMTMSGPDILLGASGSMVGRVADAIRNVQIVREIPDLNNPEKLKAVLQQGGQVFGGYGNYVRGQAMMKLGYYVSNSGQPLFETTYAEGFAKALFGINPEGMDDYYRILEATSGGFSSRGVMDKISTIRSEDVDDIAQEYYTRIAKIYKDLSMSGIDNRDDLWYNQLEAKIALENTLFAILPEDIGYAVRKRVSDRIDRNINTTGVDELIGYMTTTMLSGAEGEDTIAHYLRMLDNSSIRMTPEQREDVRSLVDYFIDIKGIK